MVLTENMFLRQEYHSIMPFLLISSKEVHRMCLSDNEIKLIIRVARKRNKNNRFDYFTYYRIGLIDFFLGNYYSAYSNFKNAFKYSDSIPNENCSSNTKANIIKWYVFSLMVLVFCENKIIDFLNIRYLKLEENKQKEKDGLFSFPCCTVRKTGKMSDGAKISKNKNGTIFKINNENEKKNGSTNYSSNNSYSSNGGIDSLDSVEFCKEMEVLLTRIKDNEKNWVEVWWLLMYIGLYAKFNSEQYLFTEPYDPKYCVKKIKEKDVYLSYISYAEMNYIINDTYRIDEVLSELIFKYKNKVEAYLKYWQLLVKGVYKNLKKLIQCLKFFGG